MINLMHERTLEEIERIAARRKKREERLLLAMHRSSEQLRARIQRAREAARRKPAG